MQTRSQTMPSNAARFDDLESKLDKMLELQTASNTLMSSLSRRVDSIDTKLEVFAGDIHDHEVQLTTQKCMIEELQKELDRALEYIDILENRQREKNLKLLNVPESAESERGLIPLLMDIIATEWGLQLQEDDFEKAHRLGPLKEQARRPRGIIFQVQRLQTKVQILKAIKTSNAGRSEETDPAHRKYRIIPDISVQTQKKRDAFWPLRDQLHRNKITTRMRHPATLVVVDGEEEFKFSNLQEAKTELCKRFPAIFQG